MNLVKEKINGTVLISNDKEGLYIKAKDGVISVIEIQGENAKKMNIKDFLKENKIEQNEILNEKSGPNFIRTTF